jgi:CheY-like chemotaxis protein
MSDWMLSTDLVFSSRAAATARAAGRTLRIAATADALLQQVAEPVRLVIVDLTAPGCDVAQIVQQLRQQQPPPRVVAYAPHVMSGALERAREAGCDQVLTRGQFDKRLDQLLQADTPPDAAERDGGA